MKRSEDLHTFPPGHPGGAQRPPHFGHSLVRDAADGFFRNWRWLALFAALTIAALAAYARFTPPDYESEMTFLVRNNRADVIVSPDGSTTAQQRQTDVSDAQIATEVQMLSSRDLALEL